ncbi:MAG: hypothetical protein KAI47_24550, partial [Deltaproteobacteria bacterium]|nr:hypothetical protein [Deltaproteobacteria bacterium]
TKLDGTAKGGVILGIAHELKLPVRFVGIGEQVNDLRPFDPEAFAEALFAKTDSVTSESNSVASKSNSVASERNRGSLGKNS